MERKDMYLLRSAFIYRSTTGNKQQGKVEASIAHRLHHAKRKCTLSVVRGQEYTARIASSEAG